MRKKVISIILAFCMMMWAGGMNTEAVASSKDKPVSLSAIFKGGADGLRCAMERGTGLFGYVDEEGQPVTQFIYEEASDFINGVALVGEKTDTGRRYSAINTKGEQVVLFDETLGQISYFDGEIGISSRIIDGKIIYRLLNGQGQMINDEVYDHISADYYGSPSGTILVTKDGYKGIINKQGEIVIPLEYSYLQSVWNGDRGVFSAHKKVGEDQYKMGYVTNTGEILLPCEYDSAAEFQHGFGIVEKAGKYAVINRAGEFVTGFEYDSLSPYSEGLAPAGINGKFGCIDMHGNVVIPIEYADMNPEIKNGVVQVTSSDGEISLLDNPLRKRFDINIFIDDTWLYTDSEAVMKNDRVLVPFRAIAEGLKYNVSWDDQTQEITLQNEEKIIRINVNSNQGTINLFDDGKPPETKRLDVPAQLINNRTFVPIRFVAEATGASVEWDQENAEVKIITK